ncbi:MAG: hypothetical protein DIU54_013675 [Acidobacteriota bacterium]|jgi:TolB protein|nr:MAG: hypothetical protein DIU54_02830 [Acidobacteriota bacterium]
MTTSLRSLFLVVAAVGLASAGLWVGDGVLAARPLPEVQTPRQVDEIALSLSNPAAHPRLAIPDFHVTDGDAKVRDLARTVAEVLWNDIDFEQEYYLIPRRAAEAIPVTAFTSMSYDQWAALGADVVLHGTAYPRGQSLVVELRLIAVRGQSPGAQHFGKQYVCGMQTARGPRDCAHQIADDFHAEVRQLEGIARTKIAFASDRDSTRAAGRPLASANVGKEIYLVDYDGAHPTRLTANGSLNISPSWSPTGGLIAYTSYVSGYPDIYVANLAQPGRGLQRPAQGTESVHNQLPAWSPDGQTLAFVSNRDGSNDIWIVNRDGSGLQNLTPNMPKSHEGTPTWSPDGQQIAFTSDVAGQPQLYVMNRNGTGRRRLTGERIDRPTWSKQNFLAFSVGAVGAQIGILDFNNPTAGVQIITDGIGVSESPTVSPNGRHIAFVTTRWGRQEIAVMDRTGGRLRRITNTGNNTFPNWQPIPGR